MKQFAKKLCSIVTVIAVILSAIGVLPVMALITTDTLQLNTPLDVQIEDGGDYAYLYYTPEVSGQYVLTSYGSYDVYAELYLDDGTMLSSDDDSGEDRNFILPFYLEAGQEYHYVIGLYDAQIAYFTVELTPSAVQSVTANDVTIYDGWNKTEERSYNEETDKYDIIWERHQYPKPSFSVTLADGTVVESKNGSIVINGTQYYPSCYDNQSYVNLWGVGTHQATLEIPELGLYTTFNVIIEENPIVDIHVDDIYLTEGVDSTITTDYNEETDSWDLEYTYYYVPSLFTATLKDGTVITSNEDGEFYYEGRFYGGNRFATGQSYYNQWGVGTHNITCDVLDVDCSFNVIINPSPIKSVTLEKPVSIVEESNGYWDNYWDDELNDSVSFFRYQWQGQANAIVEFTDGNVITVNLWDGISFDNKYHNFIVDDNQHRNPWSVGNTYNCTASIMGKKFNVPVTIIESPIKEVVIENITLTEYLDSDTYETTINDTGELIRWEHFDLNPAYTVYLTDGSVLKSNENGRVEFDGMEYSLTYYDNQNYENYWVGGNTYTIKAEIFGVVSTFDITIEKSPFVSLEIEDGTIYEGEFTGERSVYDPELDQWVSYNCYNYWPRFTLTLNDGTTIEADGGGIFYDDDWHSMHLTDDQSATNHWGVGAHSVTGTMFGLSDDYTVTIAEHPVKSISVKPISIQEGTKGWTSFDYDEMGNKHSYYRYQWYDEVTITVEFNDGTTQDYGVWENVVHGDLLTSFDFSNNSQSWSTPWTAGNTYTEVVNLGKITANAEITITEAPYESIDILWVNSVKETDFDYIDENGNKRYYVPNFGYRVNFKDGTSSVREYHQHYEDFRPSTSDMQYSQPWTVGGNNIVTVTLGKATATFNVNVVEVTDWEYVVQNGEVYITGCGVADSEVIVPSEIDGMPVVGIMNFGNSVGINTITLPDSVTYISDEAFENVFNLYTVNLGASISNIDPDVFAYTPVDCINVSEENPYYCTINGIVYNKAGDTLVVYPRGQGYVYCVPDNVVDASVLFTKDYYSYIEIEFSENSKAFKKIDGVTYTADMTTVLYCDQDKEGSYVMPDTVTTIKEFAFSGSQLSSITVSDKVSEIVYNTFSFCSNLETINLPDTLQSIGDSAFFESNIKNLSVLPSGLTSIGSTAFANTQMTSVTIPGGVAEIGHEAFARSNLATVQLLNGIQVIGSGAFMCNNISEITIPESVEYISYSAFESNNISSLVIPDTVTQLGSYSFASNPISKLTIGSGICEIPSGAFAGCLLTSLTTSKNIEWIGDYAFSEAPISKLVFEADEIYLGNGAFYGCPLDDTSFSDNLKGFGSFAFSGNSMTSVTIPDSVTYITYYSFAGSKNLAEIDLPETLDRLDGHAFDETAWYYAQDDGVIYLDSALYGYKGDIIEDTAITVKNGTTVIADYAFDCGPDFWTGEYYRDFSGLKSVILPNTVKTIGEYAFFWCNNLESITIPESVEWIGDETFMDCFNLTIYGYENTYAQEYALSHGIPFEALTEKETDDVKVTAKPEVLDENSQLIVETVPQDDIVNMLPDNVEYTNVVAFDIHFELDGQQIQPNGSVTVEIAVPDNLNGKNCEVYHIADDGTMTKMNAIYKDGKMIFETTHFSIYAIVENSPELVYGDVDGDGSVNNRDLAALMLYLNGWKSDIDLTAADVFADKLVDNKDFAQLMRFVNGWDVVLGPTA